MGMCILCDSSRTGDANAAREDGDERVREGLRERLRSCQAGGPSRQPEGDPTQYTIFYHLMGSMALTVFSCKDGSTQMPFDRVTCGNLVHGRFVP